MAKRRVDALHAEWRRTAVALLKAQADNWAVGRAHQIEADRLAEQHTTALAEQSAHYATNPRVDDAGDGEAPQDSPPGDAQRQSEPSGVISAPSARNPSPDAHTKPQEPTT